MNKMVEKKIVMSDVTGNINETEYDIKFVTRKIGQYEIVIMLSGEDKFIDIYEIRIKKDFRTFEQKMKSLSFHDIEEYYKDEYDD